MTILRAIVLLLLGSCCAVLGFGKTEKIRYRCTLIENLSHALGLLRTAICYRADRLCDAAGQLEDCQPSAFWSAFARTLSRGGSAGQAWEEAERSGELALLSPECRKGLRRFSQALGKTSRPEQEREFELAAQTLSRELEQTRRELQSKGKLNSALGVLGGVILVILFI